MSILINNYPIFEDNQVLTSGQLNQLHNYLDQQTQLTRSCLIGMGIACGLELDFDEANPSAIVIREGLGISSEGFLIKLCPTSGSCTAVQYRDYTLPVGVVYTPFQDEEFNQDVTLFELLTSQAEIDEDEQVSPLTDIPDGLEDKVVILFLECLDNDLKSCLGKSCDELGIDRIFNLRKLLISETDLAKVNARSNGGRQDDLFLGKFDLKTISMPRIFFNDIAKEHYIPFAYTYVDAISNVYIPLREALEKTYTVYEPVLADLYGENPFSSAIVSDAFNQLEGYLKGDGIQPAWLGVQYVYDYVKDLILAYQEFRDCAYDLMVQCCPDMTRFPRHLMLGKVVSQQLDPCELDVFRHKFTQPPIYNNQNYLLAKTQSLHKRLVLMIEKFSFDRLRNFEQLPIKATPSCEKKEVLSLRSIPFYYDSKGESEFQNLGNLELEWYYHRKNRACQLSEGERNTLNLSYDNNSMVEEAVTPLTTPLHYDMDQQNFLRLEGFQGKSITDVLQALKTLKEKANIDFNIEPIFFGDQLRTRTVLPCFHRDLQADYEIWRGKLFYFLDVFARFTNVSNFLSQGKITPKTSVAGRQARTETLATEPLYEELNTMRNINIGLNSKNWASALDQVSYNSKAVNMKAWTSKAKESANVDSTFTDTRNVGELYDQIRDCIAEIRNKTPENMGDFSMRSWLNAYKCPLKTYQELLKLLASRIPRGIEIKGINRIMSLYCALHEILRNLFLYPYIDIRILSNTLANRIDRYEQQHSFSEFLRDHPGLEHKAGVEQGQTFVLLFQALFSEESRDRLRELFSKYLASNKEITIDIDDIIELDKAHLGKVVGDFTLPYKCCDPCSNLEPEVARLDPIAQPICIVVSIDELTDADGSVNLRYLVARENLFHTMYEPERYRARLTTEAQFGDAKLQFYPFEYDTSKNTQGFTYQVDVNKVAQAGANSESAYLIETISYELFHTETEERIDASAITILIPLLFRDDVQTVGFRGTVFSTDKSGKQIPIPGAEVWTTIGDKLRVADVTGVDGLYQLSNPQLVDGSYILRTTAPGYFSAIIRNVKTNNQIAVQNIELQPIPQISVDGSGLLDHLKVNPNSSKAILVAEEFETSAKLYEAAIADAIEAEATNAKSLMRVEEAISRFNNDETLTVDDLHETYAANRDVLLDEIKSTDSNVTKKNRSNALRIMTNSYMDRLLLKEPAKLTTKSAKVVKESARLITKSGVAMKENFNKWATRKEGVLGNKTVNSFKTNFKI